MPGPASRKAATMRSRITLHFWEHDNFRSLRVSRIQPDETRFPIVSGLSCHEFYIRFHPDTSPEHQADCWDCPP
jgi:hypothetical protein